MYENIYGKTPPRFVTLPLGVEQPCFYLDLDKQVITFEIFLHNLFLIHIICLQLYIFLDQYSFLSKSLLQTLI